MSNSFLDSLSFDLDGNVFQVPGASKPAVMPAFDMPEDEPGIARAADGGSRLFDRGVIWQESRGRQFDSNGNPLTSKAGAIGIAQVMPGTAPEAARLAGLPWDEKRYRTDPDYNASLGRAYFNKQLSTFGDEGMALAAYNAGPGRVQSALRKASQDGNPGAWLSYLPAETRDYVPKIMGKVYGAGSEVGGGQAKPQPRPQPASASFLDRFSTDDILNMSLNSSDGMVESSLTPPKERTWGEAVMDPVIGAATGIYTGVKSISDAFGADNPVSEFSGGVIKALQGAQSQARQVERQSRQAKIQEAEDSGNTWDEIVANVGAFADAPLETTLNALGSSAPTLLASVIPGIGQVNAARFIMQGAIGAAQGAGAVKGSIYEKVQERLEKDGMSKSEAAKVAAGAQAYDSQNAGQIALGALLGAVAGTSGIENTVGKLASRRAGGEVAEQVTRGVLARTGMGILKESPIEGFQGGQERVASNIALQNLGYNEPTFKGAIGQGFGEAVASAGPGAIGGYFDKPAAPATPAPNGPLTRALNAGAPVAPPVAPAASPATPPAPAAGPAASTPTASPLDLGDASIDPAMAKLSDEELQSMMADVEAREEDATDDDWVNYSAAMAELDRRKTQPATPATPVVETMVETEKAVGQSVPPPGETASSARDSQAEKQPEPPENSAVDAINFDEQQPAAAQDVAPSAPTVTPAINNLFGEVQAEEVPAPDPAPSTEPEPAKPLDQMSEAELRERVAYIGEQAKMNGGWSKPLIAERNKVRKALEAITRKAAPERAVQEPQAADQPQQGDVLNNVGLPFKFRKAAEQAAKNTGAQVVPVQGGFVVRMPQNMSGTPSATMGTRTDAKAGPGFTAADVVRRDPIAGQKINDEWTAFAPQSGTLGIPRAEMPQVKAGDRGAMVNFLKARGIDSSKEQLPPTALKPTQAEFSPAKVQEAADRTDGDRSIIVSADGYVVDGHHQWLAQRQKGEPINVIRLDQPITQVLDALKEMPSAQPEQKQDVSLTNEGDKDAALTNEGTKPAATASDSKPNQPPDQQASAEVATENVAKQPDKTQAVITRADVAAAERIAADMIRQKIGGMKAGEVQRIAARFLPTMGKKAPVGKVKIADAMTDVSAFSLLNPAAELGVELSESVKRALMADREGRVVESSAEAPADQPTQEAATPSEGVTNAPTESRAPFEPNPLEHTPKQYADAWLRWSAETNGLPLAEVREMQGDEAGLKNIEQRWVDAVVNQAKSGQSLPAKTLDKLLEIRPNTVLPESAIPAGYQRPEARKLEKAQKSAPAGNELEAIFSALEAEDSLKKRRAKSALDERPDAEVINQVESQFYDMLLSLMERGDLEVNGHKTIHEDNKSCL